MAKAQFRCEECNSKEERLSLRDSDGKWVCTDCVPAREKAALRAARERGKE